MTATINQLDLSEALELPEEGWVLADRDGGGRYWHRYIDGCDWLIFTTDKIIASEDIDLMTGIFEKVSFDEARDIAKSKPENVRGVVIFKAGKPVGFHWVK